MRLEDADEGEGAVDFAQHEHCAIVERDDAVGGGGGARGSARGRGGLLLRLIATVDTRHVCDDVDHVCAQLVRLHVDGGGVGGEVYLGDHVEEEGLARGRGRG